MKTQLFFAKLCYALITLLILNTLIMHAAQPKPVSALYSNTKALNPIWDFVSEVDGDHLYLAGGEGVNIFDISDNLDPLKLIGSEAYDYYSTYTIRPTDMVLKDNYLIMLKESSSAFYFDLTVIDVSDKTRPKHILDYDLGPIDAASIKVKDDHIFLSNYSGNIPLIIYNISDIYNIQKVGEFDTTGTGFRLHDKFEVIGDYVLASAYDYSSTTYYIAVLDVSDPSNVIDTAVSILDPGGLNDIRYNFNIYNDYLLMDHWGSTEYDLVNISDPLNPNFLGSYNLGYRVGKIVGDKIYSLNSNHTIDVANISDPTSLVHEGVVDFDGLRSASINIFGFEVINGSIYLWQHNSEAHCYDISDKSNPISLASYSNEEDLYFNHYYGNVTNDLIVSHRDLFLSTNGINHHFYADGNDGLSLIALDSNKKMNLVNYLGNTFMGGRVSDQVSSTDYVYTLVYQEADEKMYLKTVMISDRLNPVIVSSTQSTVNATHIQKDGNSLYLLGENGLEIFTVSNPVSPVLEGSLPGTYAGNNYKYRHFLINNNHIFIVGKNGLKVIDVSNKLSPLLVTDMGNPEGATSYYSPGSVVFSNNHLYVPHGNRLQVIDVSDPLNPTFISAVDHSQWGAYQMVLAVQGSYVFMALDSYVDVVDVADPTSPVLLYTFTDDKYIFSGISSYSSKAMNVISKLVIDGNSLYVFSWEGITVLDISGMTPSYVNWQNWFFSGAEVTAGLADGNLDADGDGVSNSYEYLFGMNPRDGTNAGMPASGSTAVSSLTYPAISFNRRIDTTTPITYTVEYSDDLVNWTSGTIGVDLVYQTGSPSPNGDGTESVTLRYYQDHSITPKLFFRVSAVE